MTFGSKCTVLKKVQNSGTGVGAGDETDIVGTFRGSPAVIQPRVIVTPFPPRYASGCAAPFTVEITKEFKFENLMYFQQTNVGVSR